MRRYAQSMPGLFKSKPVSLGHRALDHFFVPSVGNFEKWPY